MTRGRIITLAVFLLLACLSGGTVLTNTGPPVTIEERVLDSRSGSPLRVVYVYPPGALDETERTRPAIVAIPPHSIQPEAMEIICVEAARRGAVCAIPDFFGETPAESRQSMGRDSLDIMREDVLTVVYSLWSDRFPCVNRRKTGVCGHSVGGTVTYLVGFAEPNIAASVPIGMETEIPEPNRPRNLLFLSGLYDEIHYPMALLENLADWKVADKPELGRLYGSFENGTARMVTVVPTTDHFIETFDPILIRELFAWYAKALDHPEFQNGKLREFRRRLASMVFAFASAGLYAMLVGLASARFARAYSSRMPEWLATRGQALPLLVALPLVYLLLGGSEQYFPTGIDLMLALVFAQELASHHARSELIFPGRSPYRILRGALFVALALGAGTLVSYGVTSAPNYARFPEMLPWYPAFVANMSLLFPLEVWGRSKPWLFDDMSQGIHPGVAYFVIAGLAVAAPGLMVQGFERVAREALVTIRARLRPLGGGWLREKSRENEDDDRRPPEARVTPLKLGLAAALIIALAAISYKRINEGFLTTETAAYAGISILRFAVLPFVFAGLIIRTRWFRRQSRLD